MLWIKFRRPENSSIAHDSDKKTCPCLIKESAVVRNKAKISSYVYVSPYTQAGRQEEERKLREKLLPFVSFVPNP